MAYGFLDIALTPSVEAAQRAMGTDHIFRDFQGDRAFDRFTENEEAFIATQDTFFMATVSETDWPYIQHRGGPPGFLKVLDDKTLGFADYRGNRQYISVGNLAVRNRAALILLDYPRRARLKIFAHVEVVALDADPDLAARVKDPEYNGRVERAIKLHLDAFDWNCPQHITPRFTQAQISEAVEPLQARLAQLESENQALKAKLAAQHEGH
jgi:predicted pyridoxine 5'-phosphate oxidase superfamily flavin-nucleotide-binding protein